MSQRKKRQQARRTCRLDGCQSVGQFSGYCAVHKRLMVEICGDRMWKWLVEKRSVSDG